VSHCCDIWLRWSENTPQLIPFCLQTISIITEIITGLLKYLISSCTDLNVDSCSFSNLKYWLRLLLRPKIQTPVGVHSDSVIISVLKPSWTKLDVCPDSCSFRDDLLNIVLRLYCLWYIWIGLKPKLCVIFMMLIFFCGICLHIHVNGSVWHSHSSKFYLSTWLKFDLIFVNRWSTPDVGDFKWVFCKNWKLTLTSNTCYLSG